MGEIIDRIDIGGSESENEDESLLPIIPENKEKNMLERQREYERNMLNEQTDTSKYHEDTISLGDSGLVSETSSRYKSGRGEMLDDKLFRIENFIVQRYKNNDFYCGTFLNNKMDGLGFLRVEKIGFYEGEFSQGFFDGIGHMKVSEEYSYLGEFLNGLRDGIGKNIQGDLEYTGEYNRGLMEGVGEIADLNGPVHQGFFANGYKNGYGEIFDKNRAYFFQGYFKDGGREGKGIEKSGNASYYGGFKNGQKHGIGSLYHNKKLVFLGEFESGEKTGFCHCVLGNEQYYDGVLYKGQRHGIGRMSNKNSNVVYTGQFRYDKRHGFGRLETNKDIYVGNWADNKKNGIGYFKKYAGESYYGYWKDGKREGLGYETFQKREYKGEFKDDLYHGRAIVKAPGKDQVYALFEKGRLIELIDESDCRHLMKTKLDIDNFFSKSKKKLIEYDYFVQDSKKTITFDTQALKNELDENSFELKDELTAIKGEFQAIRDKFDLVTLRIDDMKTRAEVPIFERKLDRMWIYDDKNQENKIEGKNDITGRNERIKMFDYSLLSKGVTPDQTEIFKNSDRMMLDLEQELTHRSTVNAAYDEKIKKGINDRTAFLSRKDYRSGAFGSKILDSGGIRYVSQFDDQKFLEFANKRLEEVVS